jgi:uncharacterized membrane protein
MSKQRLEAFSDGVIAILITIMVLELKVPHGDTWHDLGKLLPVFLSYVLSYVYLGIYWNNHHHMLHLVDKVSGKMLWANLYFLFWLSLLPFATAWMGENHNAPLPTAMMGFVLLMCALGWGVLQSAIVGAQGPGSKVLAAVGRDRKSKLSGLLYIIAIPLAFVNEWISDALYVVVALIWFVPDRRFAAVARAEHENHRS